MRVTLRRARPSVPKQLANDRKPKARPGAEARVSVPQIVNAHGWPVLVNNGAAFTLLGVDFDEASGAVVNDSSGNGKYGVLRKGATRSLGMRGGAVNLDGAAAHISISPIGELKRATIAAWINPHQVRADESLLCTDGSGPGSLKLVLNGNGAVQLGVEGLAPQSSEFRFIPEQAGEWRHVAVTYDPEAKAVAFYIDGKLDVTRTITEAPSLKLSQPARIGGAQSGARGFSGEVDEFLTTIRAA
jgi:hypothetical protein